MNFLIESIETKDAPTPIAHYSQACITPDVLSTSGQIGINPKTNELEEGEVNQIIQAIKNVEAIKDAGHKRLKELGEMRRRRVLYENRVFFVDSGYKRQIETICGNKFTPRSIKYIEAKKLPLDAIVEIRSKETFGFPKDELYFRTNVHSCDGFGSDAIADIEKELGGKGFSLKDVFYAEVCTENLQKNYGAFNQEFARSFPHKPSRTMYQLRIPQKIQMFCEAYHNIS